MDPYETSTTRRRHPAHTIDNIININPSTPEIFVIGFLSMIALLPLTRD